MSDSADTDLVPIQTAPVVPGRNDSFRAACFLLDAMALLAAIPDGGVDLIVTDPPYESLEKHRKRGTTTRLKVSEGSSNEWFPVVPNSYFHDFSRECHRVLARNSHLYVYVDVETDYVVKPIFEAAGFRFWNRVIWRKPRIGMGYHYRRQYEAILFFEKGKRKLADLGIPDVLPADGKAFAPVTSGYPTEKPWELSQIFVDQSSSPGEIVLDPFMGSASTGEAALRSRRRFLGGDIAPRSLALAQGRLLKTKIEVDIAAAKGTAP